MEKGISGIGSCMAILAADRSTHLLVAAHAGKMVGRLEPHLVRVIKLDILILVAQHLCGKRLGQMAIPAGNRCRLLAGIVAALTFLGLRSIAGGVVMAGGAIVRHRFVHGMVEGDRFVKGGQRV
jgi:hypothetical protein